jgi:hypothetical protein
MQAQLPTSCKLSKNATACASMGLVATLLLDKPIVNLSHAIIAWTAEEASGIRMLVGIERGKPPANTPQMGVGAWRPA